ncbi:MAG: ABC transporter ATP-binding protein [Planctomycetes bacterium]|nr:ABC transporter ATP-binding protein [Planctomycetota bacterium]MCB9918870.1 ABC transporter ATP-binding protein [Planctomycetota bacterium]
MPVLEIRGLAKSYDDHQVLYDLDLELEAGTITGLVGPNGVGKTTCLRCIVGLVFPTSGTIHIDGVDARSDGVRARRSLSFLPGEASVYRWMTGREFLRFGLGFHDTIDDDFVGRCLEAFELPMHRKLRGYSSGQKQMLALTVALGPRVPLYILDEPEKALDASKRHRLRELLDDVQGRGASILISSHHISELELFTSRYAFLNAGRVVGNDEIDHILRALSRRVRVRFEEGVEPHDVPSGVHIEHDGRDWILHASDEVASHTLATQLLKQRPLRLEVGTPSLSDVYDHLYVHTMERAS